MHQNEKFDFEVSFALSGEIRFLLVPDQPIVTLPRGTGRHNMWWLNQLPLLPDVVFIPCPVTQRAAAENSDMIIP